ncbi:hypothetical protein ACROYT_G003419 [Oculina patagonica]
MAENDEVFEVVEAKAERKRKPNFSVDEISVITESVQKNLETIQSKFTNTVTNKRKNEIWQQITKEVNALGYANREVREVKDKWKNLHSTAKKEFSEFKRESKKTGGGPPPKKPSQSSGQIIEIFEHTPAFSGLSGFETGADAGAGDGACLPKESAVVADDDKMEAACSSSKPVEVKIVLPKKKVSNDDVLRLQYECLSSKKRKLDSKKAETAATNTAFRAASEFFIVIC